MNNYEAVAKFGDLPDFENVNPNDFFDNLEVQQRGLVFNNQEIDYSEMSKYCQELGIQGRQILTNPFSVETKRSYLRDVSFVGKEYPMAFGSGKILPKEVALPKSEFVNAVIGYNFADVFTTNSYMDSRIYEPEWEFREGGDNFYGGIGLQYDPFKGVVVTPAIARVQCFNFTLANNSVETTDVQKVLPELMNNMNELSGELFSFLQSSMNVHVPITDLFVKLQEVFRLSPREMERAYQYFAENNATNSLYDVIQAITYATQHLRNPKKRTQIEQGIFTEGVQIIQAENPTRYIQEMTLVRKSDVTNVLNNVQSVEDARSQINLLRAA